MTSKISNIAAYLVGLLMIIFGANKFFNFMPMPEMTPEQLDIFGAFGKIKWLMPLIGAGEIIGGFSLAKPQTRALGALMLFPITLGIMVHAISLDNTALPIAGFFFLANLYYIWENRAKYMTLIS